jgi:hypothetical protein
MEGVDKNNKKRKNAAGWLKKIGLAGFLFFLVKGLVWIAVFMGVGSLVEC